MAVYDNPHSRRVAWLKWLSPLLALAILSTLFLVSDHRGVPERLPYSQTELDRIVGDQRVGNPAYAGVTPGGTGIVLTADSAQPAPGDAGGATATDLMGVFETPDGGRLEVSADSGRIDNAARTARLAGGVSLRSSTGYRLETAALTAALDRTHVQSDGEVTGTGPPGRLRAGHMELLSRDGDYLLHFTGGVKLIYHPQSGQGERK